MTEQTGEFARGQVMRETQDIPRTDGSRPFDCDELEWSIVQTVAYSDVFDYPLMASEIQRYLIGVEANAEEVAGALANGCLTRGLLASRDGYYMLPGREDTAAIRRSRESDSGQFWRAALRYGRLIAGLPFVRMVAVTGELAMDNVRPASDIDYFIVTSPDRLWFCRLLTIGIVRVAAVRGITICPNYLISERALSIPERNLYAAHEVAQMVPISGHGLYNQLRDANDWVEKFLPNASGVPRQLTVRPFAGPFRRLAERTLSGRAGARIERWEMGRKARKLSRHAGPVSEAAFSADWCKGHIPGHEGRILAAFDERTRALEGSPT